MYIYIYMYLLDSFLLFTYVCKMLEFNALCYKKKPYVKI